MKSCRRLRTVAYKIVRLLRYVVLAFVVCAGAYVLYGSWRTRAPNVLVIVIDTLRADRLGCYGNPRGLTPFMDGLAAQGAVFLHAYSTTSWTCPAVASLLTSRYPSQHHVVSFASLLADEEVTLAERLSPLRYVAGGLSANFRLLQALGYAQGFQYWRADLRTGGALRADELRRQSLEWLDGAWRASSSRPCFLYLQFMDPHAPYDPPEPYRSRFQRGQDGVANGAALNETLISMRWHELTRAGVDRLESLYDGEAAMVDAELRRLFGDLERRGFLENAIVIITADHGEEFWEHGALMHGTNLYNENVLVPLILVAPGYPGGQRVAESVSLVDVAPTVLDLLGLAPEPRFEGRSLLPLLRGRPRREAGETVTSRTEDRAPPDVILQLESTGSGLDVRDHADGIIRRSIKVLSRLNGLTETYDLASDPGERQSNPRALESESAALAAVLDASRADLSRRAGAAASSQPVDEATREKLRALGYRF